MGLFSKKKPETAMDALIKAIYGPNPPAKSADIESAVAIVDEEILASQIPIDDVRHTATALASGRMPYSTHDLVLATALAFFKDLKHTHNLMELQLNARMQALEWVKEGKAATGVVRVFEEELYNLYKPDEPTTGVDSIEFENFKLQHSSKSLHDAARAVRDFMIWQRNYAMFDRPDGPTAAQEEHAERIEKAFLVGAAGIAAEGFSLPPDREMLFLKNVLGMYKGLDIDEIEAEIPRLWTASDAEEKATRLGGALMIEYLLRGKSEVHEVHLSALQRLCWRG